nr:PREDICTED: RELT-like protein 1 [Latimeria chalumnae]|eukprot:XP_014348749.1 PREDICTED: RELT-like protein 1 [Latimeria chalumnae]
MKNEANAEMLNALVVERSVLEPESPSTPNSPDSPTSPFSPAVTTSKHTCQGHHLHTVGGVAGKNACTRCGRKRWPLLRQSSRAKEVRKSRPGEVTVLAVGRFRVTKVEHRTSKEQKSLLSESTGGEKEETNGDVPTTPDKMKAPTQELSSVEE